MAPQPFITMANKFQSVLDADVLNERGHQVGVAKRERLITPFRLGLSVVASLATQQVQTLADLHRQFNALWELESDYKAFYKSTAPEFFRTSYGQNIRTYFPRGGYASTIACASVCLPLPFNPYSALPWTAKPEGRDDGLETATGLCHGDCRSGTAAA